MNRTIVTVTALFGLVSAAAYAQSPQASGTVPAPKPPESLAPAVDTSAPAVDTTAPAVNTSAPAVDTSAPAAQPAEPGKTAADGKPKGTQPSAEDAAKTAAGSNGGKGTDRLELGTTEISGNRELPKVLYVVPWRRPEIGDAVGRPPNSLVDEALTPVDRDVFRRQNRYYSALEAGAAPAKSQPAPAGAPPAHVAPKDEK